MKMNMKAKKRSRTGRGFFKVPHGVLDNPDLMKHLTQGEKFFFVVLCKLYNQYAATDGWFWHTDKAFTAGDGSPCGFERYGISPQVCKSARKKLVQVGLIETRRERSANNVRYGGTVYRLTCTYIIARDTKSMNYALAKAQSGPSLEHHKDPRIREIENKKKELISSYNLNKTTGR